MKTYPFITIIGNVATGKSTLAPLLAKVLKAKHVKADELFKTNPFFDDAVADRTRWSLASDLWFLRERIQFAKKIEKQLAHSPVVQDSGLLMSWVYANSRLGAGFMTQKETDIYNTIYDDLTKPLTREHVVVYLQAPIDVLLQRIKKRGRTFEILHHDRVYLEGLHKAIEVLIKKLDRNINIVPIQTQTTDLADAKQRKRVVDTIQKRVSNLPYATRNK